MPNIIDKVNINGTSYDIKDTVSGYLTTESDPTVPAWAKAAQKPTYTASEVGAVPTSRTVNGKALTSNITLSASDVNAVATSAVGSANGVVPLNASSKIDESYLPSYVDDVIEGYYYNNKFWKESTHTTEITGEAGKIYVDLTTDKTYRFGGTSFVEISSGTTVSVTRSFTSGTKVGTITVNGTGTDLYAPTPPSKVSELSNDSGFITGMTILSYGISTWQDFLDAYNANKVVYCRASSNSNPASGSQTRLAFMAYVSNATNPTNVEFQYYRSMSSHSETKQGDEVYVYKLANNGTWTVTVRKTSPNIVAGTGLSRSYSNDTVTLSLSGTIPTKTSDLTNDSGFITGISSSDVTTALGYTPYNSTNPNGYVNAAGASAAAPVQSVNSKTGTVTLSAADVGALPSNTVIPTVVSTYASSGTDAVNGKAVYTALQTLDSSITATTNQAISAITVTDGKITSSSKITIPTVPSNVSAFSNDAGYITGISSSDVTTALGYTPISAETDPIFSASAAASISAADITSWNNKVSDDHKWNDVELQKNTQSFLKKTYVPQLETTSATIAKLTSVVSTPESYAIAKYDDSAYLNSTTPSSADNSTKVATTAFVKTVLPTIPSNVSAFNNDAGYITDAGVTGVKGNAESSYRTGQVNLTAANIGAVATSGNETVAGNKTFSGTTTLNAASVYPASQNTILTANAGAIIQSPIPKYLWHDIIGFCRATTPTYYTTTNGSTWTEATLEKRLFAHMNSWGNQQVLNSSIQGSRWVWHNGAFAYSSLSWIVLGITYNANIATFDLVLEATTDATATSPTWTTLCSITGAKYNSQPIWIKATGPSSTGDLRLTITRTSGDTTTNILPLCAIEFLTTRWGDQGKGSEFEYPYNWDGTPNIYPIKNNVSSLGTSSYKWANVYATTLTGNVTGTATGNLTSVQYDSTNAKLTYTKNGSNTDIVTIATLKSALDIPQVYSPTNTGGYLTMDTLPIYDGTVETNARGQSF